MVKRRRSKRRVLRAVRYQTGRSSKRADKKRRASKPGKRLSARGRKYWETRRNRSDLNRRKKL